MLFERLEDLEKGIERDAASTCTAASRGYGR